MREMGKGENMSLGFGPEGPALPPVSKKRRTCTIINIVIAFIATGVILCPVFGGDLGDGECNLFQGQWVPNPSGPSYSNTSCHFIDDLDNCQMNGRPDTQYLYWRWKPYHGDLPPFDPVVFMNAMRNKSWALIGDSILRNQMQSLICLLSKVEEPVEIYHDKAFKSRTFYFPNHNITIACIFVPFLAKSVINKQEIQLHLDVLESSWTTDYHKYDYVVISGGQWFLKTTIMWENGKVIGCHNCEKKSLNELGVFDPYRKVLRLVFNFITSSDHKPLIFFRTWSPDHFEYAEWDNGGICNRSQPYTEGQFGGRPTDHMMWEVEIEEYRRARGHASERGIQIELLDIFHLSLLRPDGHPGPYRTPQPYAKDNSTYVQNDCLHWCLPGPVETWNELMMEILLNSGALHSFTYQEAVQGLEFVSSL